MCWVNDQIPSGTEIKDTLDKVYSVRCSDAATCDYCLES